MQFEEKGSPEVSAVETTRFTDETSVYAAIPTNEEQTIAIAISQTRIQFFFSFCKSCFKPLTTFLYFLL